jgi:hypothetical protein
MIAGLLLIWMLVGGSAVQTDLPVRVELRASRIDPLVGEPVTLQLRAVIPAQAEVVAWPEWAEVGADSSVFELRRLGPVERNELSGDRVEYIQTAVLVVWLTGEHRFPTDLGFVYRLNPGGDSIRISGDPVTFSVPSVLDPNDLTLRPLKASLDLAYVSPVLIVVVGYIGLLILIWMIPIWRRYFLGLTHRGGDDQVLRSLQKMARERMEPERLYIAVAESLRDFLARKYTVVAHELTTTELLDALRDRLPQPLYSRLGYLMIQADLVKFARYAPDQEASRRYLSMAVQWLQAVMGDSKATSGVTGD